MIYSDPVGDPDPLCDFPLDPRSSRFQTSALVRSLEVPAWVRRRSGGGRRWKGRGILIDEGGDAGLEVVDVGVFYV